MASSDRTQFKQAVGGSIGDSRLLAQPAVLAANGCVAQDAQRFESVQFTAAVAANTSANYSVARLDRPVKLIDFRFLPSAAITVNGNTTFVLGYTNDNGGALQNIAVFNTNANTSLGMGNMTQWVSVNCLALAGATLTTNAYQIPAGSHVVVRQIGTSPSEALPAGSEFQLIWEEV